MGIIKIGHGGVSNFCEQISNLDGSAVDSDDDFNNCEPADVSCELAIVEGQLCNFPYELFDLPNLREILSVETWNSCLTEEERYSLTAYLPDMDERTFWLTMKELLGGSEMHFGNPVDTFFKRLKGGVYPPKVAAFRDCLQFMQRRKYYHSLRSYHENMIRMFKDMKTLWNQCRLNIGVEERLRMWRTRRTDKSNNLLDLNTTPEDGDSLGVESKSDVVLHPSSQKMRFFTPKCSAKGVLKLKSSGNTLLNHNPRGVLKVVPKAPSFPQSSSLGPSLGLPDQKVNSSLIPVYFRDTDCLGESCFPPPKLGAIEVCKLLEKPQYALNQQGSILKNSRLSESSTSSRKIKRDMNPSLDEIAGLGKHRLFRNDVGKCPSVEYESYTDMVGLDRENASGKDLWRNSGMVRRGTNISSLMPISFKLQYHGGEQHRKAILEEHAIHPRVPDMIPRILDDSISKQELQLTSSDQMKDSDSVYGKLSVSERFKDVPLTYKRRKAQIKRKSLEFGKPLAGADLKSASK